MPPRQHARRPPRRPRPPLPQAKPAQLVAFLVEKAKTSKVIVFVLTCAAVDYYAAVLPKVKALVAAGVAKTVEALHGRMPQKRRVAVYDRFLAAPSGVLLCTDVAARGVDIPDVDWIVQFDPPQVPPPVRA